ncbi:MAG: hypothetical protein FWH27_10975 [Planctomycetaceae bacterium]|nr:hypothetical protein [Planctomycetaceae bacterium]
MFRFLIFTLNFALCTLHSALCTLLCFDRSVTVAALIGNILHSAFYILH